MAGPVIVYENGGWRRMLPLVYNRATCQLLSGSGELLSQVRRLIAPALAQDSHSSGTNGRANPLGLWCRPGLQEVVAEETGLPVNQILTTGTLLLDGLGFWRSLPDVDRRERAWVGTAGDDEAIACLWADEELARELHFNELLDSGRLEAIVSGLPRRDVSPHVRLFRWPWELVNANDDSIARCWPADGGGCFGEICPGSHLMEPGSMHIGSGTRIKPGAVIDAESGPVWIGNNVDVSPHSYIQGPAWISDECVIQPGAIIKGGTTLGPVSKAGGEIQASIIHGFSNKQHDGFLGNSYIGQWVNIGADAVCSNLKNTYGTVRVPIRGIATESGELCAGLLAGDHSRIGIGVHFPTGAVVGFGSCISTPSSPQFVPSLTWVTEAGMEPLDLEQGLLAAERMMARRARKLSPSQRQAFLDVAEQAAELELGSPWSWPRPSRVRRLERPLAK